MSTNVLLLIVFLGIFLCYFFTKVVIKAAQKNGIVDKPRVDRFHTKTTALMGGIAIMFAFIASITSVQLIPLWFGASVILGLLPAIYFLFKGKLNLSYLFGISTVIGSVASVFVAFGSEAFTQKMIWLTIGAEIIFLTGAYDDKSKAMKPSVKLIFQLIASSIIAIIIGGVDFLPAPLNYIFLVFWSVGLMNAFNLIDNMNGLSPGVACLVALSFGIVGLYAGVDSVAIIGFGLSAVLLGFLPHNFPNAKIFMGDSGSMLLGFIMSALAAMGCWQTPSIDFSLLLPLGLVAYPIFDVTLVTVNRIRSGRPVYLGGKDHSSHLLVKYGFSAKDAVLVIYAIVTIVSSISFLTLFVDPLYGSILVAFTISMLSMLAIRLTKMHDTLYMPNGRKKKAVVEKDVIQPSPVLGTDNKKYRV